MKPNRITYLLLEGPAEHIPYEKQFYLDVFRKGPFGLKMILVENADPIRILFFGTPYSALVSERNQ